MYAHADVLNVVSIKHIIILITLRKHLPFISYVAHNMDECEIVQFLHSILKTLQISLVSSMKKYLKYMKNTHYTICST